jgi:hypothetical protein
MLAMAGSAVLVAGCGGAKPKSGGANAAQRSTPGGGAADAYKYAQCMRQHGVSGFEDPVVSSSPGHQSVAIHITPAITGSPAFKSAQVACAKILPGLGQGPSPQQQAAHRKGLLDFATCMRAHGVASFPDPNTQGQITPQMLTAANLNLHAPAVDSAARTCIPASDGVINAAAVNHAINGGP